FDIFRGKRPAVVPLHILPQEEDQAFSPVLQCPLFGQLRNDRIRALLLFQWIEQHQIVVTGHRRPDRGNRGFVVDREARRGFQESGIQNSPGLGCLGRIRRRNWEEHKPGKNQELPASSIHYGTSSWSDRRKLGRAYPNAISHVKPISMTSREPKSRFLNVIYLS